MPTKVLGLCDAARRAIPHNDVSRYRARGYVNSCRLALQSKVLGRRPRRRKSLSDKGLRRPVRPARRLLIERFGRGILRAWLGILSKGLKMAAYDDLSLSEINQAILNNCSAFVTLDSRTDLSDREKEIHRDGLNVNLYNLLKRKKFLQGGYVTQRNNKENGKKRPRQDKYKSKRKGRI